MLLAEVWRPHHPRSLPCSFPAALLAKNLSADTALSVPYLTASARLQVQHLTRVLLYCPHCCDYGSAFAVSQRCEVLNHRQHGYLLYVVLIEGQRDSCTRAADCRQHI